MTAILLALFATIPLEGPVREHVAVLEINHCYEESTGDKRWVQAVFWDWHMDGRCHVIDWRLVESQGQNWNPITTFYDHDRKAWRALWGGVNTAKSYGAAEWRDVTADAVTETHTTFDPEADDRQFVPIQHRPGLMLRMTTRELRADRNTHPKLRTRPVPGLRAE